MRLRPIVDIRPHRCCLWLLIALGLAACSGGRSAPGELTAAPGADHRMTQQNRAALQRYLDSKHEDLSMMADDVVFTTMATGEEHRGRDAVRRMLNHVYHVAFDAHAETRTVVVGPDHAALEALFVGRHIGDFAGVPATGREVRVPLAVVYDFDDHGRIQRGRVYLEIPAFLAQAGAAPGAGR